MAYYKFPSIDEKHSVSSSVKQEEKKIASRELCLIMRDLKRDEKKMGWRIGYCVFDDESSPYICW